MRVPEKRVLTYDHDCEVSAPLSNNLMPLQERVRRGRHGRRRRQGYLVRKIGNANAIGNGSESGHLKKMRREGQLQTSKIV